MRQWCAERRPTPLGSPESRFFKALSAKLNSALVLLFKEEARKYKYYPALKSEPGEWKETKVLSIGHESVRRQISKRTTMTDEAKALPWISLDRAYTTIGDHGDVDYYLDVTRIYDIDGCKKIGLGLRPDFVPRTQQGTALEHAVDECVAALRSRKKSFEEVVLVDNGLYSGGTMAEIIELLHQSDINVRFIFTALARDEGTTRLKQKLRDLEKSGGRPPAWPGSGLNIPGSSIRDWVCERDFLYGVPLGGRTAGRLFTAHAIPEQPVIGIPYSAVSTNDLSNCAGIGSGAYSIAKVSLELSIALWSELERINGVTFAVSDMPRIPFPLNRRLDAEVVPELRRMLEAIP